MYISYFTIRYVTMMTIFCKACPVSDPQNLYLACDLYVSVSQGTYTWIDTKDLLTLSKITYSLGNILPF